MNADRSDKYALGPASPLALYKLIVPLLRCEVVDIRDAAVNALGMINHDALKWVFFVYNYIFYWKVENDKIIQQIFYYDITLLFLIII